jgi:5,10-methylene-tetrahydrofolate dehydrogenase/methenyl tetrahydrofolate cyclohydrolase
VLIVKKNQNSSFFLDKKRGEKSRAKYGLVEKYTLLPTKKKNAITAYLGQLFSKSCVHTVLVVLPIQ